MEDVATDLRRHCDETGCDYLLAGDTIDNEALMPHERAKSQRAKMSDV